MAKEKIDADPTTLGEFLGNDKKVRVPTYQRTFAWTSSQIDDLWADLGPLLEGKQDTYFLGAMVFVRKPHDSLELVDGQQRLAALLLFFAALRDRFRAAGDKERATIVEERALRLKKDLRTKDATWRLELTETDNGTFTDILESRLELDEIRRIGRIRRQTDSVKLLASAYLTFHDHLCKATSASNGEEVLFDYFDRICSGLQLIQIVTNDEGSAYTLFETLNDRGVDLTLSDLLKNYLFSKSRSRLAQVRQHWTEIVTTVGQGDMTQFIRHEWMSRYGKVRQPRLYAELKKRVRTQDEVLKYIESLRQCASVYAAFSNSSDNMWRGHGAEVQRLLAQIHTLGVVQCYPLLMAAKLAREPREFDRIAKWVVALTIRFSTIGGKGTGNLETVYANAGPICWDMKRDLDEIKSTLKEIYPEDDDFKMSFRTRRIERASAARLVLAELENYISGNSEKLADSGHLTLEHILPKSPDGTWPQELREAAELGELLHRVGNLTLLTGEDNSSLPADFAAKKLLYQQSSIEITKWCGDRNDWDEAAIDARQEWLADQAAKLWQI